MRKIVEVGYDFSNDQMRYSVIHENGHTCEVRISLTAKAQAEPSPEVRINEWFDRYPEHQTEVSVLISDYYFDCHYL